MKRAIAIGGVALLVIIAGAVVVLWSSLDSVVRAAVEKVGSEVTGTKVTLAEVEISPTSGSGALRRFKVTNPSGFSSGDAFRFDEVTVRIDVATLASDPVIIEEIVIRKPEILYEIAGQASNLQTIKRNADAHGQRRGAAAPSDA